MWLRQYPTQEVLGFLFGVSGSTALRAVRRCLPVLDLAGRDTIRMVVPQLKKLWQPGDPDE